MSDFNFQKRSVDNIRANSSGISSSKKPNSNLVSRILGVILSFALAFLLYSLYQEYSGLSEDEFRKATIGENAEQGQIDKTKPTLKKEKLSIEVTNGYTDEPIKVRVNKLAPYSEVSFQIKKPNGALYEFNATSKITGVVDVEIPSESLKATGEYEIKAISSEYEESDAQKFFLRAGKVSPEISEIKTKKKEELINKDLEIEVILYDKYKNPISGREVTLVSTRLIDDIIQATSDKTDEKGKIKFLVQSTNPGKSSFLALDKTQGITLEKKVDIIFKDDPNADKVELEGNTSGSVGQSATSDSKMESFNLTDFILNLLIEKASAQSENVSYFTIESPSEVNQDEEISVLIKAMSSSNKIVTDYSGKVKFSSSDPEAMLPEEYTFTANDKGEHLFKIKFMTSGGQSLVIEAVGSNSIRGEKQLVIKASGQNKEGLIMKPEILSPPKASEGKDTVLSSSQVDIAGKADANMTIEIYDDTLKIGEVMANDTGLFFFKTETLVDGKHNLKVRAINSAGDYEDSDFTPVIIDTTNPIVLKEAVSLSKKILAPEEETIITIRTEPGLESARAIINSTAIPLVETTESGVYTGNYIATDETGTFPVDIELKDEVSNPITYSNQAEIIVTLNPEEVIGSDYNETDVRPGGGYNGEKEYYPMSEIETSPDTGPKEVILFMFVSAVFFGWCYLDKKNINKN